MPSSRFVSRGRTPGSALLGPCKILGRMGGEEFCTIKLDTSYTYIYRTSDNFRSRIHLLIKIGIKLLIRSKGRIMLSKSVSCQVVCTTMYCTLYNVNMVYFYYIFNNEQWHLEPGIVPRKMNMQNVRRWTVFGQSST